MHSENNPLRQIKSFVRRRGRQSDAQKKALSIHWPSYGLTINQSPFSFHDLFPNMNQIVIEVGFGMGQSLIEMAQNEPHTGFIGIEVHEPGVGNLLSQAAKLNLNNIRVYAEDAVEVLKQCIPDNSLDRFQLFFPDPWPKKRHHKRRIVQVDFIHLITQKLKVDGKMLMATDWAHYAEQMMEVLESNPQLQNQFGKNQFAPDSGIRPATKFENRGIRLGHKIFDLVFVKHSFK